MIAGLLCAWLAGVAFGWQLRQRHLNHNLRAYERLARRSDQYTHWARQQELES